MFDPRSVILAIASPPGRSAYGLIRASGDRAFEALNLALDQQIRPVPIARAARRARIALVHRSIPARVLTYPAPRSYTGNDCFEIILPGHPGLMERVIELVIERSRAVGVHARRAEPGEFTAHAFLNGKLTLLEAEGVQAAISAQSDAELRAAHMLTSGRLGALAATLADDLAGALALVEAGIDFTDQEDVVTIAPHELLARLRGVRDAIRAHLQRAVAFEEIEAIPWVVLCGEPNAGKSTLFNALLGRTRAVVSGQAGTTRDVLAEPLHLTIGGRKAEVMLVDVAGRVPGDSGLISGAMQAAAQGALGRAELIIECTPVDAPNDSDSSAPGTERLRVRTKADLLVSRKAPAAAACDLAVSAHTGDGLSALRAQIAERVGARAVWLAADALVLRPRHERALREASMNLDESIAMLEAGGAATHLDSAELIAGRLRAALDALASLAGTITPDEILGRIFASFCIGK